MDWSDNEPVVVRAALRWMYDFDYAKNTDIPPVILHTKVYAFADKYIIPGLKAAALANYADTSEESWNTPEFSTSIKLIYETTPPTDLDLRNLATMRAANNATTLFMDAVFKETMRAVGEFGMHLGQELNTRLNKTSLIAKCDCPLCP